MIRYVKHKFDLLQKVDIELADYFLHVIKQRFSPYFIAYM